MARLMMRRGPDIGMMFHLNNDIVRIGRGSKNDIIIHDNEISREHCRLLHTGDGYTLEDMNSSNGTFVNSQRVVKPLLLRHGFYIELGDTVAFEFEQFEAGQGAPEPGFQETDTALTLPAQARPPESFSLLMASGPDAGRVYSLAQPLIRLGRDLTNDIVIQDPEVSRFHARLRRMGTDYQIEDLGSTNGTRLNDVLVTEPRLLQNEDSVSLGTGVQVQYITAGSELLRDAPTSTSQQFPQELHAYFTDTEHGTFDKALAVPPGMSRLGTGLEAGSLTDHIFVAYSREDWERFVASLTVSLQDAGLNVWVEQYLKPDDPVWRAAVDQALQECWLMVIIMSPRSLALNPLKSAYRHFLNNQKPVIPLVYEPLVSLPIELARQRIILHDKKNPRRSVHKLIYEIKEMRKQIRP